MGIFGFNYNKEGPGIEKNAPEKNVVLTYLDVYKRNFWNLTKLSFMYTIASIPMIIILITLFTWFLYPHMAPMISELAKLATGIDPNQAQATYLGVFSGIFIIEMLLMFGSGPASASFAFIARSMTRDEHVWLWSDFINKFKENFKQSLIVSVINIVAMFFSFHAMSFYIQLYNRSGSVWYFILFGIILTFLVIFILMNGYIYQMIVTLDNKLTVLYKNACILAFAKLPKNLLLILIPAIITYVVFTVITPVLAAILCLLVWVPLMRLPMEFFATRTLQKIIDMHKPDVDEQQEKGTEE